ncbi:MAG: HAD-IC family P-type ATPase [Desulfobulbus sp.]|nr:HAD-IC family P-type ATPase [Desulfobulbus sp.]
MKFQSDGNITVTGLTAAEAEEQLRRYGLNEIAVPQARFVKRVLEKFWAPVPWMLEAAIGLELWLDKYFEGAIIAALIVFNAVVAMIQEGRARAALAALKSRLALNATVHRDGVWKTIPAREVVPGDLVKLTLGGVVPADVRLTSGELLLDQSMLTGESIPVEIGSNAVAHAGTLVRRGEAEAVVTATGIRTKFGRTAELIETAHATGSQQTAVLHIVRNLALFNGIIIIGLVGYARYRGLEFAVIEPIILTAVLASIPVSLPATFTMVAALAAHTLAQRGVLATRLSALDEAGTMDVLCSDKTGTLTRNSLQVTQTRPAGQLTGPQLLELAVLASSDGGADPVDTAIRIAAPSVDDLSYRLSFLPFDPTTKRAEAFIADPQGGPVRHVVKGAFAVIAETAVNADHDLHKDAMELEAQGYRVLAVAQGTEKGLEIAGLIALSDPPREDAAALISRLQDHGVRMLMVTGDAPATAEAVARQVGLTGRVCSKDDVAVQLQPDGCTVFAGVLPEDKFTLVHNLQTAGHTVGMCGDGANDAPALRQAHMGIAVSQATDIAKAAAGLVLTEPGLNGVMAAVEEGRKAFRKVQTYALNSIVKKISTVLFIAVGFFMTGHAILTPLLMIVLLVVGDFLSMAIAVDRVVPSQKPNVWRVDALVITGAVLGVVQLIFAGTVLAIGTFQLHLAPEALTTLAFITLVFSGQAALYAIRTRHALWETLPSGRLVAASVIDIIIGVAVAVSGQITAPLPGSVIVAVFLGSLLLAVMMNLLRRVVLMWVKDI